MNKTLLIASTVAAFVFASCDNENTTNPEPLGTVTIKGSVVSNFDEEENEPPLEKAPTGVSLYFIDDNTDATLGTTTTNATGDYTIDLQIGGPRNIRIVVGDFQTDIKVYDGVEDDYINKPAIYSDREQFYVNGAVKGATYIQTLEINQPTLIDF